ncbi:MAG: L-2-hydroxyglutarate oxidase, partial [Candidatus Binatia bacterium]
GRANGLRAVRRLRGEEMREFEPHVAGVEALRIEETGIVDFRAVARQFAEEVHAGGGTIRTGARLHGVERRGGELALETSAGEVRTRTLVNCGGLQSDRIARLCGLDPGLRIIPFRGEYYELAADRRHLVRNLVYPVPDPRFPFLGVHFTRRIDGAVEAGPNAVLALHREGYERLRVSPRDVIELLAYRGFWRMAARYWRTGLLELRRSFSRRAFVRALQRLVPDLRPGDVRRAGAGVRAQAVEPDGLLVDDFRIVESESMLHVLNAPSPAATASITIGRRIALRVGRMLGRR